MQENIESFVSYFGPEHCYEFTVTANRLSPDEFQRRMNSATTNCLRRLMPDRISVVEPHESGFCHQHFCTALPFTSPNFDHRALRASREAFKRKNFKESQRQWLKVRASMSPELSAFWDMLRQELPKYGLGNMISLTPIREGARAIARYFGKYLAKGIANRPKDWVNVRLVRYSGANGDRAQPWKNSSPLRSSNSVPCQNLRDKARAVARVLGCDTAEQMKTLLGPKWYFYGRAAISLVQLPVYRSLIHADADGVPVPLPEGTDFAIVEDEDGPPGVAQVRAIFPDWAYMPYRPRIGSQTRPDSLTPMEAARALCEALAPTQRAARMHVELLRAFTAPAPVLS